ncbi:hypothetical protein SISSUDRAFT_1067609 [Sistotremastrum suecicum HHB10207 ss-3]|uniref:WW domain-containing protein n=1 Tax=Sistotremastrum suecicum HHB10207 ss-3 TaxID=1314776 RepID=A0A165WXL6_9AGAM|nr:hypothetical protein SISSUDRAFT_1067609 [Sistotremastrum suecicum HHB10207 ss-3]
MNSAECAAVSCPSEPVIPDNHPTPEESEQLSAVLDAQSAPDADALGRPGMPPTPLVQSSAPSEDPVPPYTVVSLEGLRPMSPNQSKRYIQKTVPWDPASRTIIIPPGLFSYNAPISNQNPPEGWRKEFHPEGQPYWYNSQQSVVTSADMVVPEVATAVVRWVQQIASFIRSRNLILRPNVELVLEPDAGNESCGYYYADTDRQTIFWLSLTDTISLGLPPTLVPTAGLIHIENILRQQFYTHVEYFPNQNTLDDVVEDGLLAMLAHGGIDGLTCLPNHSTFPFDPEQCRGLLALLNNLRDYEGMQPYRTCAIGRLLSEIYVHRVINYHGERHVRLSRLDSVWLTPSLPKSFWISITDSALWKFPSRHHQALCGLWVDRIAYIRSWNSFLEQLTVEWERSIALSAATIMCNLTLKVLLRSSDVQASQWTTVADGFSAAATSMALVGLVSGVIELHLQQEALEASEVVTFMQEKSHPRAGLYPLAILFSIPMAACVWSLFLFTIAIATATFGTLARSCGLLSLAPAFITLCAIYISLDYLNEVPGLNILLRTIGDLAHRAAHWLQGL